MEYTLENTEGYSPEDLKTLNIIYIHRVSLLLGTDRNTQDERQRISENVLTDYDTLLLPDIWDRCIHDFVTGEYIPVEICDVRRATGLYDAVIYLCDVPDIGLLPVLRYCTGLMFLPYDWQAGYRSLPCYSGDIEWVGEDGQPADRLNDFLAAYAGNYGD